MKHIRLYENHGTELPAELTKKIQDSITTQSVYWDYHDQIPLETLQNILNASTEEEMYKEKDEIYDSLIEHVFELEVGGIKDAMREHKKEIAEWLGMEEDDLDLDDLAKEHRENFEVPIDYNFGDIRQTVECSLQMHSNYEGLPSDYDHNQNGYVYEDYFKDIVDILMLNPAKTPAEKPNLKGRDGKEYVTYEDFKKELANNTSLSVLTFLFKLDAKTILEKDFSESSIVIPKGNFCGLFSPFVGGGSLLEMKLLKPIKINYKKLGKTKYDNFKICIEGVRGGGYTIDEVYGMTSEAFGKKASFEK